jgi:putative addiction module component (TIGR02574 family)
MSVKDIPNFEALTDLERLGLAEEVAGSIRNPEALPPPVAHRLELEKRWVEFERNPSSALSQEQFWAELQVLTANVSRAD